MQGHLGLQGRYCGCELNDCKLVAKHNNQTTREVIEAAEIYRLGKNGVSVASLGLSQKELIYLIEPNYANTER